MNIIDWIHNPQDITIGRALFKEQIRNAALYKVFSTRDSEAIRARLVKELRTIAGDQALKEVRKMERELEKAEPLPDELKPLEQRKSEIWRESQALKVELNFCDNKERRCELAHKILNNFDEINEIWAKINNWHKTKTLPTPPPDPEVISETNPVKLIKIRNNLRANISKVRNKPDKIEKFRLLQRQLEQVEKLITPAS
jgi:hypothetical protein